MLSLPVIWLVKHKLYGYVQTHMQPTNHTRPSQSIVVHSICCICRFVTVDQTTTVLRFYEGVLLSSMWGQFDLAAIFKNLEYIMFYFRAVLPCYLPAVSKDCSIRIYLRGFINSLDDVSTTYKGPNSPP